MHIEIYNPYSNNTVADMYVATVAQAFKKAGYDVVNVNNLEKQKRKSYTWVFVVDVKSAVIAKLKGYKKVYLWVQGIIPEESYMRNNNKFRYFILSVIERMGLICADFALFVSNAMLEHFKQKYNYKKTNYYIMPCFNAEINRESFLKEGKYSDNVFLYAGSLDVWQCFDKTAALYKKIEEIVPNAVFRVLTSDKKTAEETIKNYGIKSYSIDFVPSEQIPEEMSKAKFGFSIREEHPVNKVSTPTKLSTYISNGLIPIYSQYISDFHSLAKDMNFTVCADNTTDCNIEKIKHLCLENIKNTDVLSEFEEVFGNYYSREFHIENMSEKFKI